MAGAARPRRHPQDQRSLDIQTLTFQSLGISASIIYVYESSRWASLSSPALSTRIVTQSFMA